MAKDPAFLFYDGDAARDVSHMNRLERGAYFDLMQAQRKFGGYTTEQARKILGKDFNEVWPALELILNKSDDEKYFIEWVRDSIENRKEHAEKQRKRIQDYWDKKKAEEQEEQKSNPIPRNNHGISMVIPLENEIEDEDENVDINISREEVKEEGVLVEVYDEIYPFKEFWNDYDKKVGEKEKLSKKWDKVSIRDRKAIKEYIPKYKAHQPDKKYRKNPETFLNNKSWNDELIPSGAQVSKPKGVTIVQSQEIFNELNGKQ